MRHLSLLVLHEPSIELSLSKISFGHYQDTKTLPSVRVQVLLGVENKLLHGGII